MRIFLQHIAIACYRVQFFCSRLALLASALPWPASRSGTRSTWTRSFRENLPPMPRILGQALWKLEIGEEIWAPHMLKQSQLLVRADEGERRQPRLEEPARLALARFLRGAPGIVSGVAQPVFPRAKSARRPYIGRIKVIWTKKLIDGDKQDDFVDDKASEPGSEPGEPTNPDNASTVILGQSPKQRRTDYALY